MDGTTATEDRGERICTEDMLATIDQVVKKLKEDPDSIPQAGVTIGSIDANTLCPSIEMQQFAEIAAKAVENSKAVYEGIAYDKAAIVIALNQK